MTTAEVASRDPIEHARALLAAKPDGLIEAIAREAGVSTRTVLELLPAGQRLFVAPERFEALWQELASWGTVLFLMHTPDIVLEVEGALPVGSFGHGYYNIHGDSPIGGHIKAENCRAIYLVDRATAQGRRACSVQFFNASGEVMFKIFVRRDASRALLPDQLNRFEALKASFV
ncbi:heme utilization cystosolic carrier protein HutX [Bosea sp. SSUT16]|jgi:putative heme utilization carrier protein HutX|uniref:Heme utilization cystosolic carrier protein HutX n=1 Tax=Bosea spartocytisi TaxID=2773451 RepID=A0A927HZF8_9HYPH|nr:heme utilization cystosolic carrier protein HutX [Bosea spartocytisi]MBD3846224.1 heme utilization cystosolic carrier protein HutX [Bosea spartocytisi]MCT4473408.1 heme utilization cystosolic carrier protein HutX [Bosea spartocytisi]